MTHLTDDELEAMAARLEDGRVCSPAQNSCRNGYLMLEAAAMLRACKTGDAPMTDTPRSNAISPVVTMGSGGPDLTSQEQVNKSIGMCRLHGLHNTEATLRALSTALETEKRHKLAITGDKINAVSELRQVKAERDALKAENARLREALSLYSCDDGCNDCPKTERDRVSCGWTALRALEQGEG